MGTEPGEQGASRFSLHTELCGQVPDWERERRAVDLLGLKVAIATPIPRRHAFFSQILTKTGELSRQPTTHPEETEEELTEQQQEALLGEGALTMPREGSTESESTQEDLEEEEDEEEEEEDCIQVKDEDGESGPDEGPDLEESSAGYRKVPPTYRLSSLSDFHS